MEKHEAHEGLGHCSSVVQRHNVEPNLPGVQELHMTSNDQFDMDSAGLGKIVRAMPTRTTDVTKSLYLFRRSTVPVVIVASYPQHHYAEILATRGTGITSALFRNLAGNGDWSYCLSKGCFLVISCLPWSRLKSTQCLRPKIVYRTMVW
jgi:hypothetical protein